MEHVIEAIEVYGLLLLPVFLLTGSKGAKAFHAFNMKVIGLLLKAPMVSAKMIWRAFRGKKSSAKADDISTPIPGNRDAVAPLPERKQRAKVIPMTKVTKAAAAAKQQERQEKTAQKAEVPPEIDPAYVELSLLERQPMWKDYLKK